MTGTPGDLASQNVCLLIPVSLDNPYVVLVKSVCYALNTWDYSLYHFVHGQTQFISGLSCNSMGLGLILLLS